LTGAQRASGEPCFEIRLPFAGELLDSGELLD
jgi:hypothetical protein